VSAWLEPLAWTLLITAGIVLLGWGLEYLCTGEVEDLKRRKRT